MSLAPPSLEALLTRYSVGPKYLTEPGPSPAQLALMAEAALRAPDHAELVPYRFKVVRGAAKEGMAALFADAARAAGKGEEGAAMDAERALKPPLTVAVVVYFSMLSKPPAGAPETAARPTVQPKTPPPKAPAEEEPPVEEAVAPPDKAGNPKPAFDFYKILPDTEVKVPDEELSGPAPAAPASPKAPATALPQWNSLCSITASVDQNALKAYRRKFS